MKNSNKLYIIGSILMILFINTVRGQDTAINVEQLIGTWKLDMSPQDTSDNNFAMMRIASVAGDSLMGEFYREGVAIKEGRINTQRGIVYAALVSGDNSGEYNTSFYLQKGVLYGSTHALNRKFLAVWTATKVD